MWDLFFGLVFVIENLMWGRLFSNGAIIVLLGNVCKMFVEHSYGYTIRRCGLRNFATPKWLVFMTQKMKGMPTKTTPQSLTKSAPKKKLSETQQRKLDRVSSIHFRMRLVFGWL